MTTTTTLSIEVPLSSAKVLNRYLAEFIHMVQRDLSGCKLVTTSDKIDYDVSELEIFDEILSIELGNLTL